MRRPLVVLALALLVAPAARAQTPEDSSRALRARMASDLRNLVTAQEAHFAENNRYAAELPTLTQYKSSVGNTVRFLKAESNGWGAEVRSVGFTGTCVIHINLPASDAPRTEVERKAFPEGEPACDGDGKTEAERWASQAAWEATRVLAFIAKQQERHFGRTGAYAASPDVLPGYRANPAVKVTIEVTPAGGRMEGYLATATHDAYPAFSCVMRSGVGRWMDRARTKAEGKRPTSEMSVVCDTFK